MCGVFWEDTERLVNWGIILMYKKETTVNVLTYRASLSTHSIEKFTPSALKQDATK